MTLEEEKLDQGWCVKSLLKEEHKVELWKILAFWEKYKEEWEKMRDEFWNNYEFDEFKELILQCEINKDKLIEWLSSEERKLLGSLNGLVKDKFYKEYLFDRIVYGWNVDKKDSQIKKELFLPFGLTSEPS